ncbi:MAG: polysaccharide deacetylase family protein [Bacteroidales bacterium]|nr:polysaccharide deacetylase family protein [Bacteroidales bacterium]
MEMLILVPKITNRLYYIFELMLKDELGIDFKFTTDKDSYLSHEGAKLHYGKYPMPEESGLYQQAANILFEHDIADQDVKICNYKESKAIYPVFNEKSLFPFDIFAASFYIISRYEEYLPHVSDNYNRFQPQDSILYKMEMMERPVINLWSIDLGNELVARYPGITLKKKTFRFVPTYDVDAAWAYRNKGFFRTTLSLCRDILRFDKNEIKYRWDVLRKKKMDPFDTFEYQIKLQKELKLSPLYFILCGDYNTNDKNISIKNKEFQQLIKHLGDYALVGIHPSFSSYLNKNMIKEEITRLSDVLKREVTISRQHFLRLSLPSSYQILIELDITDDYTMGYASQAGFRAGYADTFKFFDLENDMKTKLNIHPFALMDGTMRDYLNLDVQESYEKAKKLVDEVKNVNGTFILLWHNETLSGEKRWEGWITLYRKILDYILN